MRVATFSTYINMCVNSGGCYSILQLICCEKHKECHRGCFGCVLFLLSMFVRFLFVFDLLLILFRIVLWPSVGIDCNVSFSLF